MEWDKRILIGITCTNSRRKKDHWKDQLKEIKELGIKEITLFPTTLNFKERKKLYKKIESSGIKKIKLVHIRGEDFTSKEINYFYNQFGTRLFNCHEENFDKMYNKFPRFRKNILLEMNYDNVIKNKLEPNRLGGFCVDLSHFYTAYNQHDKEYDYIMQRLNKSKFQANHLNGYSHFRKLDLHFVTNKNQFDYLKKIPEKIFGKVIGLELENSVKKQLEFKKYIIKLLNQKFKR